MTVHKKSALGILLAVLWAPMLLAAEHEQNIDFHLNDRFTVQHRLMSPSGQQHIQLGVNLAKRIEFQIRYVDAPDLFNYDVEELRPRLLLTHSWQLNEKFQLSYKHYFEVRMIRVWGLTGYESAFQYKGKLKLAREVGRFTPYVSNRTVSNTAGTTYELETGFGFSASEKVEVGCFVRYVSNEIYETREGRMTGTTFSFKFN